MERNVATVLILRALELLDKPEAGLCRGFNRFDIWKIGALDVELAAAGGSHVCGTHAMHATTECGARIMRISQRM